MMSRVLIVEDEPMLALDLERVLEDGGFEVAGVGTSVEQAAKLAGTLSFDVAVVDLNLRDTSSAPVAAVLRSRNIPFVFVSGYRRDAVPVGFESIPLIAKPFEAADLTATLRRLSVVSH